MVSIILFKDILWLHLNLILPNKPANSYHVSSCNESRANALSAARSPHRGSGGGEEGVTMTEAVPRPPGLLTDCTRLDSNPFQKSAFRKVATGMGQGWPGGKGPGAGVRSLSTSPHSAAAAAGQPGQVPPPAPTPAGLLGLV